MSKVTFGGEGTLKIYKRVNCEETLKVTFKDANGDPYVYPLNLFEFILKRTSVIRRIFLFWTLRVE